MIAEVKIKRLVALGVAAATLALTGCGGDAGPTHGSGPRGIFTSSQDCASNNAFNFEVCSTAIRAAIKIHNDDSPTYDSKRICDAKELSCERTLNNQYRPRLLGFYVEVPDPVDGKQPPPLGKPLYAAINGEKGLRAHDKTVYLAKDITLEFSPSAVVAYKTYSGGAIKGGFGT
jgi:hypothetical protein